MHKIALYIRINNHVHFLLQASTLYVMTEVQTFTYFFLKSELFTYYMLIWFFFHNLKINVSHVIRDKLKYSLRDVFTHTQ